MEWVTLLLGVIAGAFLAWMLAGARMASALARATRDIEGKLRAAEATAAEIREQRERLRQEKAQIEQALRQSDSLRVAAETRAAEMARAIQEQKLLLDEARAKLSDAFKSLAADALKSSNEGFLTLAAERLASLQKESSSDLVGRQQAIETLVAPVKESLAKVDQRMQEMEEKRAAAYGAIREQVQSLIGSQDQLRTETGNLVKALRAPAVRGRWGEMQLKRVVEMAGMLDHCDFRLQESVGTEEGRLRPDMVVQLPGGKTIVVDAKAPLLAYLEAIDAPSEERRVARLKDHARQIRAHIGKLSAKSYWDQFDAAPDLVVLFLPGETFFSAALEQDPALIEEGVNQRVILATPTTLIALLRAVAFGWRQEKIAENAQEISRLGRELHERVATMVDHLARLGAAVGAAVRVYNETIGSFENRVLPSARRFKELGAGSKKEIAEELPPVDASPRALTAVSGDEDA